jgi:drug/metabolite transporter (DMT)-like permease
MIYILLAIISSTSIFFLFKLFKTFNIRPFQAIIINYLTAGILGFALNENYQTIPILYKSNWIYFAIFIGVLLFTTLLLIQYATQHIGMTITTIACKMSVVFPVMFSMVYFHEKIMLTKILGIALALFSVFLLIRKEDSQQKKKSMLLLLIPLWLFLGLGISDSLVKFIQQTYISSEQASLFTSTLFTFSLFAGLIWGVFRKDFFRQFLHVNTIMVGIILGISNFSSLYFLLYALNFSKLDSSIVFGLVNIGIIIFSLLLGSFIFKEKMQPLNRIGILVAVLSIVLMTISQRNG